jgi:hypothetical protein
VSKDVSTRDSKKPVTFAHVATVSVVAVVGALVAFWVLSSIVGIIFIFVKIAVIVGLIGGAFWLVSRFRR